MATQTVAKKPNISLKDFVKMEKRAACRVCKLPVEIRGQLGRPASDQRIPMEQQIKWLELVTGEKFTVEELKQHAGGRHDV